MTMQESGSDKVEGGGVRFLRIFLFAPLVLIFLPIILWLAVEVHSVFEHNATLRSLEKAFSKIEHPDGAQLVGYHTYLGEDPFVNGHGEDACYYYVAEIRLMNDPFEALTRHYERFEKDISGNFADTILEVIPINDTPRSHYPDVPTAWWAYEYMNKEYSNQLYMVYVKKTEEEVIGDYRCWRG